MIICVCKMFEVLDANKIPTWRKELLVDHVVDIETGRSVIVPCSHPSTIGAKFNSEIGEWVL